MRFETAVIELTNACNLRCRHCYGTFSQSSKMSLSDFKLIVNKLYEDGCTCIILSGGEPLLLGKRLQEYLMHIKSLPINKVILTTNGTIEDDTIYEILKGGSLVQISIDGLEKKHNSIRGKGTFSKAINFIYRLKQRDISQISLMMTIHKDNYDDVADVYNLAKSLNVKFAVEVATACGNGRNIKMLSAEQLQMLQRFIVINNIPCNDPIKFATYKVPHIFNDQFFVGCTAGTSAISIDVNGNVFPCVRLRIPVGNIISQTIEEIRTHEVLRKLSNRCNLEGICKCCENKYICGGCRARAFVNTGRYLAGDDICVNFQPSKSIKNDNIF